MKEEEKAVRERIRLNIIHLREEKNATKTWVAQKIGKTSSAIRDYEQGKATPPSHVQQEYADLFGVYVGDIVGQDMWKGETRPPSEDGVVKELERSVREKSLLHGTVEEQEAKVEQLRRQVVALLRSPAAKEAGGVLGNQLSELLEILDK
jgi:DNA-binding XRE family transcriptional regulator